MAVSIYEKIRRLCFDKHTSIRQIEIKAGLSNGTIRAWQKCNPRLNSLIAVANALEVPVEFLLKGKK